MTEASSIAEMHPGAELDTDQQEVLQCERDRIAALLTADLERLDALMAVDLIHIHGSGQVEAKSEYLDGVRQKYRFHQIDRRDLKLRSFGPIIVVTGSISQRFSIARAEGEIRTEGLLTQIWARSAGRWRQNTYHMQFLKMNGKPAF